MAASDRMRVDKLPSRIDPADQGRLPDLDVVRPVVDDPKEDLLRSFAIEGPALGPGRSRLHKIGADVLGLRFDRLLAGRDDATSSRIGEERLF